MSLSRPAFRTVLVVMVVAACQSAPDEPMILGGRQGAITNGSPDTQPNHTAVVAVIAGRGGMCSGTLISPRVVLTAGHCVAGMRAGSFRIGFGDRVDGSMKWVRTSEVLLHPEFTENPITNDLALLRLASAPPVAVDPVPALPRELGIGRSDVGQSLEFAGFGETESGEVGEKLHVSGPLGFVCSGTRGCTWNGAPTSPHTICYNQQPGGPCSGDSGGPAFVVRDGQEYVAGVTSYGDQQCAYFGCSTKVDDFQEFIDAFVRGSPGTGCSDASECRSGQCSDGVCCEAACDLACSTCQASGYFGTCRPGPDGSACDDNSVCTTADACRAGRCVGDVAIACPLTDPCQISSSCNPVSGECEYAGRPDGTACDDRSVCTSGETCQNAACTGTSTVQCPAPDACHVGICDPLDASCGVALAKDGTICQADGRDGACNAGVCKSVGCGCGGGGIDSLAAIVALAAGVVRRRRRS